MKNNPSVMNRNFSKVPGPDIPRSTFDRSHGYKTTMDAGWLIPFYLDEAVPGDTMNLKATLLARLATPIFPIMDNMFLETFFFSVPMRLVWDNWDKFNGAQDDPGDSIDFEIPQMVATASTGYLEGSIHDYFGLPTKVPDYTHSCLWHRAYSLIFNEWFRDQNLVDSLDVPTDDGPDLPAEYALQRRAKRPDYFTSSLPWPQKATASVSIPLGTSAPIAVNQAKDAGGGNVLGIQYTDGVASMYSDPVTLRGYNTAHTAGWELFADLSSATAATINQLRQSFQIQKLLERDARGGTRGTEIIKAHFGVTSPDARLFRPEFLGSGSTPINVTPVPQQSSTDVTTPQGNLAGYGTAIGFNHGFTKSFTEHCLIMGIVNVRADITYQQGMNRMFSRLSRYDFYWPALAQIGEQSVLNKEIYTQGVAADDLVFGYQERFAEMRYKPSQITGLFRSNAATPLDAWHLSQDFSVLPTLSESFKQDDPPIDRIIAVPSEPHFLVDSFINLHHARPMPVFGVPGLIDHF